MSSSDSELDDLINEVSICLDADPINLPFYFDGKKDKYFEPLTDPQDIEEWEKFLRYICKATGETYENLMSKNFESMNELIKWCSSKSGVSETILYYQVDKFSKKWIEYFRENYPKRTKKYKDEDIEDAIKNFLGELFNVTSIWGTDVRSVIEAETWKDTSLFDTSCIEGILYDHL